MRGKDGKLDAVGMYPLQSSTYLPVFLVGNNYVNQR